MKQYRLVINSLSLDAVRKLMIAINDADILSEHEENNMGFEEMPEV